MQVIQLTSVPPPTPVPARVMIDASHDTLNPWLRYSRSNAPSSSVGHLRLRHERARLEHDDRPAGVRQVRRDDAATGPGAHDDHVRIEHERLVGRAVRPAIARRSSGRIGVGSGVTGSGTSSNPIVARRGLTPVSPGSA